jgi:hypothetical protein
MRDLALMLFRFAVCTAVFCRLVALVTFLVNLTGTYPDFRE